MPKLIATWLALLLFVDYEVVQAKPQEALAKDIAAIQGTWQVTAAEEGGEQLPAGLIADLQHVFDGEHSLTMIVGEQQKPAAYTLDPTTTPKSIDIIRQPKNKTELGIYEIEGDTLRICLAKVSEPRPTKFESKSATQRFGLATFKRLPGKKAEQADEDKAALPAMKETQVTAAEFKRIYALTGKGPVHDRDNLYIYEYQGQRDGRAVIVVKLAGPAGTWPAPDITVKWDDLDQEFREKLPKPKGAN